MGFAVKMVFVLPGTVKADQSGPNGETECSVWQDAYWEIDFDRITRLEKLIGERFQHMRDTFHPFKRAGICVFDRFWDCLFVDFEKQIMDRCAPEIVAQAPFFRDEKGRRPTVKVGGRAYLNVHASRLKGRMGNETLVADHNRAAGKPQELQKLINGGKWDPLMDPPLLWSSCSELADSLYEAEAEQGEAWKAILYDPVSEAFVRGWRESLRQLGTVGARSVFRFS